MMNIAFRLSVMVGWLILCLLVCLDYPSLAAFDVGILIAVAVMVPWAAYSSRVWFKLSVSAFLVLIGLFAVLSFEPILRSVAGRGQSVEPGYVSGVRAYYDAVRSYRPYISLAVGGLFLILISFAHKSVMSANSQTGK